MRADATGDEISNCEGEDCPAECEGEDCPAECEGEDCPAECEGEDCPAECEGEDCPEPEEEEEEEEEEEDPGTLAVYVRAGDGVPQWQAEAYEMYLEGELDGYERLKIVNKTEANLSECEGETDCVLERIRGLEVLKYSMTEEPEDVGVDLVLLATLDNEALRFELYENWTPAVVVGGSISRQQASGLVAVKQEAVRAFRPVLRHGGLLDQKPLLQGLDKANLDEEAALPETIGLGAIIFALVGFAIWLWTPVLVGFVLISTSKPLRLAELSAVRAAAVLTVLGAGLGGLLAMSDVLPEFLLLHGPWKWLVGLAGGVVASLAFVDIASFVFPPIGAFERVGHSDVMKMVGEWLTFAFRRVLTVALYLLPYALIHAWIASSLDLSTASSFIVLAPIMALLALFWLALWIQCLTPFLDDRLVWGEANDQNPAHHEIDRYFRSYALENGWNLPEGVSSRLLFFPSTEVSGTASFGGAGVDNRILIDRALAEIALGLDLSARPGREDDTGERDVHSRGQGQGQGDEGDEGDDDEARARRDGEADEDELFTGDDIEQSEELFPTWAGGVMLAGSNKKLKKAAKVRQEILGGLQYVARSHKRRVSGQGTLLGYVVPLESEELVPLIADDHGDFSVVRTLLAEHYAFYAPDPDDVHDELDPNVKDFLFGALAREFGRIERRDHHLGAFALTIDQLTQRGMRPLQVVWDYLCEAHQSVGARVSTAMADAYTCLHFAGNHLVQYIYYCQTENTSALTTRAPAYELETTAAKMIDEAEEWNAHGRDRFFMRPTLRNRMIWLSRFFTRRIEQPQVRKVRKIALGVVGVSLVALMGLTVLQSISYHPVWVERIEEQRQAIEEAAREEEAGVDGAVTTGDATEDATTEDGTTPVDEASEGATEPASAVDEGEPATQQGPETGAQE